MKKEMEKRKENQQTCGVCLLYPSNGCGWCCCGNLKPWARNLYGVNCCKPGWPLGGFCWFDIGKSGSLFGGRVLNV